ncbi:hypothetical protein Scel_16140 [Streptomyces cellostaticus]|nr:hypothetical protein Scel_16140 [Streptomyces cellostaticus]
MQGVLDGRQGRRDQRLEHGEHTGTGREDREGETAGLAGHGGASPESERGGLDVLGSGRCAGAQGPYSQGCGGRPAPDASVHGEATPALLKWRYPSTLTEAPLRFNRFPSGRQQ